MLYETSNSSKYLHTMRLRKERDHDVMEKEPSKQAKKAFDRKPYFMELQKKEKNNAR